MEQRILIFKTIIIIFYIFFSFASFSKTIIKGKAIIIDGDTIHIKKDKIRLHAIDAPEKKQTCIKNNEEWPCGLESTKALEKFISDTEVLCEIIDKDKYDRFIGICFANNKNLNKLMVKNGWAIAYRYYSSDYIDEEKFSKRKSLGIWQGTFVEPYVFRKKNK